MAVERIKSKRFNADWVDGANNQKSFSWIKISFLVNEFVLINAIIELIENFSR